MKHVNIPALGKSFVHVCPQTDVRAPSRSSEGFLYLLPNRRNGTWERRYIVIFCAINHRIIYLLTLVHSFLNFGYIPLPYSRALEMVQVNVLLQPRSAPLIVGLVCLTSEKEWGRWLGAQIECTNVGQVSPTNQWHRTRLRLFVRMRYSTAQPSILEISEKEGGRGLRTQKWVYWS